MKEAPLAVRGRWPNWGPVEPAYAARSDGSGAGAPPPGSARGTGGGGAARGEPARTVLVVDDDPDNLETLGALLEAEGYQVATAPGGREALGLSERSRFDAALVDVGMPGMTGWELVERLRGRFPAMRLALVTGWGEDLAAEDPRFACANAVFPKPVELERLIAFLQGEA